jgi:hypothetical protein
VGPVEHYLSRVAPLAQGGYISVHLLGTHGGLPGKACSNFKQAIMLVNWFMEKNLDLFLSQGGQERHGPVKQGKTIPEADRTLPNIWCLKSLRMDIDRKLYSSAEKMDVAVQKFYTDTGFPRSPFAIRSGSGGYHLYWPFDRLVHPDEWQPMADALSAAAQSTGLKFDTECTVDRTRVLRIPGTKNYKVKDKPTNVEIWYDTGEVFTVAQLQQPLAQWVKPLTASSESASEFEDERNMQGGGKVYAPVDIEVVRKECGFVDHTLNTGGTDASYYLWWLSLCLARHTTNPHAVAHALSNKHHSYSQSETTEKFKDAEKQSKGPPFCATIARHGATQCPACKHNNRSSNPISIAYGRNGHTYYSVTNDLPSTPDAMYDYYRHPQFENYIYADLRDDDGKPLGKRCVLPFQIVPESGRAEGGDPFTLVFTAKKHLYEKEIHITGGQLSSFTEAGKVFGNYGFGIDYGKEQRRFFMAFLDRMKKDAKTIITIPAMGWQLKDTEYGFSFNGQWVSPTQELPALKLDADLKYGVAGSDRPWRDLVHIILSSKRPDLWCLLAAAFGSPLMGFIGHNGVLIGGYSLETGTGKTTTLSLGQAIWGSPTSMMGLDDTYNAIVGKLALLTSMPAFWDEIKNTQQETYFLDMATTITQGRSRARSRIDGSLRAVKEWELPIIYAANRSMVSAGEQRGGGTAATIARMFEFECPNGLSVHANVDTLRTDLKYNYGHMGQQFGVVLGQHRYDIIKGTKGILARLKQHLTYNDTKDRFIFAAATEIIAGAHFAQHYGLVPFDVNRMVGYVVEQIQKSRNSVRHSSTDYSNDNTVMGVLVEYLSYHRAVRMVKTDRMRMTAGQPSKNWARVLNDRPNKPWGQISVHISEGADNNPNAPYLRFTQSSVGAWCKLTGKDTASLGAALRRLFGEPKTATVGAGTDFASGSEKCWTISITGTILQQALDWVSGDKDDYETETDASS